MKFVKGLKIVALVLLELAAAFLLWMGIGKIAFGDWGGVSHLLPAVILGLLIWLGWKRPLWDGVVLVVPGLAAGVFFYNAMILPQAKPGPWLNHTVGFHPICFMLPMPWMLWLSRGLP